MKKIEVFLVLLVLLYVGIVYSEQAGISTGLTIVDTQAPLINITEPLNNSGDIDGNITFFYNATDSSDLRNCSLIINNKVNATNTTLIQKNKIQNFTLNNMSIGIYNWSINCTDNLGYVGISANWTFTVNFMKNFNGSTTNLSTVDARNITNLVLEVLPYGKINFSEGIDLSQGLDIDRHANMTSNKIELNSTALPQLNKSATLSLYGLAFANPRPLRDYVVCPSTICTEVSYSDSGRTFSYNVTYFTVYSSEETPTEPEAPSPAAAGGGGAGGAGGGGRTPVTAKREFTLGKEVLKVVLKQGQTKEETFTIKNTGDLALAMKVDLKKLMDFIVSPLDALDVMLQPGEEETVSLVFKADEDLTPDVYPREIYIKEAAEEKIISTVIEVESAKPLFDVDVEVLPEYKSIFPGEDIFMEVSLFNVRGFGRVDVGLEYSIMDFKGNLIVTEHETVAVETQAKFTRELLIPSDIKPGTYVASVKVTFEDSVGISSAVFEVKAKTIRLYPIAIKNYTFYLLLGLVVVAIVSGFLIYEYYPRKKRIPKTKEERGKLIKAEEQIKKLEKELKALESAYKAKFISEASYMKDRERIEKKLKELRE